MADSISSYFDNLKNPKHRDDLTRLRAFLEEKLPGTSLDMRYGMPSYANGEHIVVTMASQANYMSLYMDADSLMAHRDELGKLNCGKSCIRFRKLDDLPLDVIETILQETLKKQESQ
jgi:uncharacterized protein YdhG (YjbR/CyaY superfamily)